MAGAMALTSANSVPPNFRKEIASTVQQLTGCAGVKRILSALEESR